MVKILDPTKSKNFFTQPAFPTVRNRATAFGCFSLALTKASTWNVALRQPKRPHFFGIHLLASQQLQGHKSCRADMIGRPLMIYVRVWLWNVYTYQYICTCVGAISSHSKAWIVFGGGDSYWSIHCPNLSLDRSHVLDFSSLPKYHSFFFGLCYLSVFYNHHLWDLCLGDRDPCRRYEIPEQQLHGSNGSSRAHPHKNAFKSATKDANLHCIYSSTVHRYILYHLYHPHHHHHHHLSHQIIRCSTSSPSWGWCVLSSWPFGIFLSFIFSPPSSPPFIANPLPVLPPQAMDQSRSSMLKGLSRMFYDTELLKTAMLCNKHKSRAVVFISLQLSISHWVFSGTLRLSAYPPHRIPMVCAWTLSPWLS